jgi:hypothetical protein
LWTRSPATDSPELFFRYSRLMFPVSSQGRIGDVTGLAHGKRFNPNGRHGRGESHRARQPSGVVQSEVTPTIVVGVCDPGCPRRSGLTEAGYNAGPIQRPRWINRCYPKMGVLNHASRPNPALFTGAFQSQLEKRRWLVTLQSTGLEWKRWRSGPARARGRKS